MESVESMTLLQAADHYAGNVKAKAKSENTHRELFKFVHWCGRDRLISQIRPSEIGEYAEQMGGSGTSPQAAERLQVVREFLSYSHKNHFIEQKLAQHLRIRKPRTRVAKIQVREKQEAIELTSTGHAQLVEELAKLKTERAQTALQIQRAAADKDIRENAPLEAAREQMGMVEARIRVVEDTLSSAVVIDASVRKDSSQTVKLGMNVTIKDASTRHETTYMLVNRSEANSLEGRISDISPLGKALIGGKVGQMVDVETPRGKARYSITRVS